MKRKFLLFFTLMVCTLFYIDQTYVSATITLDNIYDEECEVIVGFMECGGTTIAGDYLTDSLYIGDFSSSNLGNEYDYIQAFGSLRLSSITNGKVLSERRDVYSFDISNDYNIDLEIKLTTLNHDNRIDLDIHLMKFNEYNLYNDFSDEKTIDGNSIIASSLNPNTEDVELINTTVESGIYYIVIDGVTNITLEDIIDYKLEVKRSNKFVATEESIPYSEWGDSNNEVIVWNSNLFSSNLNPIGVLGNGLLSQQDMTSFYNSQNLISPNEGFYNRVSYIFTEAAFTETRQSLSSLNSFLNGEVVNGYQYNGDVEKILDISFVVVGTGVNRMLKVTLLAVGASNPVTLVTGIIVSNVIMPILKEAIADDLKYDMTDIDEFQQRVADYSSALQTLVGHDGILNFVVSKDNPIVIREMISFQIDGIMKYYYQIDEFANYVSMITSDPRLDGYFAPTSGAGYWTNLKGNNTISSNFDNTNGMYQHLIDMGYTAYDASEVSSKFLTTPVFSGTLVTTGDSLDNDSFETAQNTEYTIDVESHYTGITSTFYYKTIYDWYEYMTAYPNDGGEWLTIEESQKHIRVNDNLSGDKYYKFSINSINTLEMDLDRENSTTQFTLYRETPYDGYTTISPENANDELYKSYMVYPGTYYIKVSGVRDDNVYNSVEDRNSFILEGTMNFIDKETEDYEFNNTFSHATTLNLQYAGYPMPNDVFYSSLDSELNDITITQTSNNEYRFGSDSEVYGTYSDIDYYKFTVSENSNIDLGVYNISSGESVDIGLYTSTFSTLMSANDRINSYSYTTQLSAGTYYIKVDNSSTLSNGQKLEYTLDLTTSDNRAPEVTLNGSSIVYVPKSSSGLYWADLGAIVTDDGMTSSIVGDQQVSLGSATEVNVTYTYTDQFGLSDSTSRTVRVYETQNKYILQKYSPISSFWYADYADPIGYFTYSHSGTTVYNSNSTYKVIYSSTTRQNSYSYKKHQLYDKVCFQKYQNDTSLGSDWNFTDEKIGGTFCRWFNTGYSGDIGDDNNYDHYEYKSGFSYDGDSTLSTYNYPDKYDIRYTDNAYYYKVTSYIQNDYINPNYGYYTTGWTNNYNYDGNNGDYYYDYSYKSLTYTDANGLSKTSYYRYYAYGMSFYLDYLYGYVDVSPAEYEWGTSTPTAPPGYIYYDTGENRTYYGQD